MEVSECDCFVGARNDVGLGLLREGVEAVEEPGGAVYGSTAGEGSGREGAVGGDYRKCFRVWVRVDEVDDAVVGGVGASLGGVEESQVAAVTGREVANRAAVDYEGYWLGFGFGEGLEAAG